MWQVSDRCEVVTTVRLWSTLTMSPRCDCQGLWLPRFHRNLLVPDSAQRSEADCSLRSVLWTVVSVTRDCSHSSRHRRRPKFLRRHHQASHSKSAPTAYLQSYLLAADTHLRCLRQNGEQPPPSRIDITGKNLVTSLIHVACPNAAGDLMYRAIKLCSRPVCCCKR
jgi:hypothetical protein